MGRDNKSAYRNILDSIFEYIEGTLIFEDILSKEDEEAADEEQ